MPSSRFRKWFNFFSKPRQKTIVKKPSRRPMFDTLEDRTVPAVLPPALVNAPIQLQSSAGFNPVVVQDPVNAANMVEFHTGSTGLLTGYYTNDAGQTWTGFMNFDVNAPDFPNIVDPNLNTSSSSENFAVVNSISATWDRTGNIYVAAVQRSADNNSGALVVQKFIFDAQNGPAIDPQVENKVIERWLGTDPILNPVIAIDNNVDTFTDTTLTEDNEQIDTMVGKAVYVAWNTNLTAPTGPFAVANFNPNTIQAVASADGGLNFTSPQYVNDTGYVALIDRYSDPKIVFTQGSADGRVAGGQLVFVFNNFGRNRFTTDASQPDGADITVQVADSVTVEGTTGNVPDAIPSNRGVTDAQIAFAGRGYQAGQILTVQGGTFTTAAQLLVATVDAQGVITSVIIQDPGSYDATDLPANPVNVTGGTPAPGQAARFNLTFNPEGSDTPRTTVFEADVDITDPEFTIGDLNVTLALTTAHASQLSVTLISPGGIEIQLIRNRIDGEGNTLPGTPGLPDSADTSLGIGVVNVNQGFSSIVGTVFDQDAPRPINDPNAAAPYAAHFRPEADDLDVFNGLLGDSAAISGTWQLVITDNRADGDDPLPPQRVDFWSLHFSSDEMSTDGFGTDNDVITVTTTAGGSGSGPYPNANTGPYGPQGVGGTISVGVDNTLGGLSPFQGRIYVAYTSGGGTNTDVRVIALDDIAPDTAPGEGISRRVNDDSVADSFSEGNRAQFLPTLAVDQATGAVGVMYYDSRYDPSITRAASSFTSSIDGGRTWAQSVFLTSPLTASVAIDAITGKELFVEPIPGNQGAAPATNGYASGFGQRQGLVMHGGVVTPMFSSNLNAANLQIRTANVTIAAGPRIITGNMGPVTQDFIYEVDPFDPTRPVYTYNNTFASDGTRQLDGFVVEFDRPILVSSFDATSVTLHYRDTITTASNPPVVIPNTDYIVVPLDNDEPFGLLPDSTTGLLAEAFMIQMLPGKALKGVGTYSYAIGNLGAASLISDGIKSPDFDPVTQLPAGNFMDQNQDTFTQQLSVSSVVSVEIDPLDPGFNYTVGDTVMLDGGTFRVPAKFVVTAAAGSILTLRVVQPGIYDDFPGDPGDSIPIIPLSTVDPNAGGGSVILTTRTTNIADLFTIPIADPSATTPLQNPFTTDSLPLVIPGPQLVGATVTANPSASTTDPSLALNSNNGAVQVTFDRDIDIASFTPNNIVRVDGPLGMIQSYTQGPSVSFTGGGGSGAVGLATISGGRVTGVAILNGGTGYTTAPTVVFSGGGGIFAAGTAIIAGGRVTGVTITNGGRGYSSTAAQNIPDGGTLDSRIFIGDSLAVNDLSVGLSITHARNADLSVSLIAPDGTTVQLFSNLAGANISGAIFDQNAPKAINEFSAPYTGQYRPASILNSATIVSGGTGYRVGDILNVQGGTYGTTAQLRVTSVAGGAVTGVAIVSGGTYITTPTNPAGVLNATTPTASGARFNLAFANTLKALNGRNYQGVWTLRVRDLSANGISGQLTNFTINPFTVKPMTRVADATLVNAGSGYQPNDFISIPGTNDSSRSIFRVLAVGPNGEITAFSPIELGAFLTPNAGPHAATEIFSPINQTTGTGYGASFSYTFATSKPNSARVFQVGIPTQTRSGTYTIVMGTNSTGGGIKDTSINSATVAAAGTGYAVGDMLTVVGGSGVPAKFMVTTVGGTGNVTGVELVDPGDYTINPASPATVTGGGGSGAALTLRFGNFLDTNTNAGVEILRSVAADPLNGTILPNTLNSAGANNNKAIPAGSTVDSIIPVNASFAVQGVTLTINRLLHQNVPDLTATLIAPDGFSVQLFSGVGTAGSTPHANFTNVTFDDTALFAIQQAQTQPGGVGITGRFTPQLPLSAFKNHGSAGNWILRISSESSTLSGSLVSWSMTLQQSVPGSGLGEPIADRATASFRIFTQDPTNTVAEQSWTAVGPAPVSYGETTGRVGAIAVDPSDPSGNTVYVSGASGGIWKTSNFLTTDPNGPTYIPLTNLGPTYSLNVGSIAIFGRNNDPNQSVIFATTGDKDTFETGAADNNGYTARGVGILRSMDAGKTWTLLDSVTNVDANGAILNIADPLRDRTFVGTTGFKIVVDPKPSAAGEVIVYAALSGPNGGVWRSVNSGKNWTRLQAGNATDVVLSAGSGAITPAGNNLQILYAGIRDQGVFYTTNAPTAVNLSIRNGGNGVNLRRNMDTTPDTAIPVGNLGVNPSGDHGRITLAAPAFTGNPLEDTLYQGWIYAVVTAQNNNIRALYSSKDFGLNWTQVTLANRNGTPTNDDTQPSLDILGGQGDFNITLAVDPNNPNIVYMGGATDVIRIDTALTSDVYSQINYDNSKNDGGQLRLNTTRGVVGGGGILTSVPGTAYTNMLRDPQNPFLTNSALQFSGISQFTNTGQDALWNYFASAELAVLPTATSIIPVPTEGHHAMVAIRDPLTGKTRVIMGNNHGVYTATDDGSGVATPDVGTAVSIGGSRVGNLQIAQFWDGATQPSTLAAQVAGALFYGTSQVVPYLQNLAFPTAAADLLDTGNIAWTGGGDVGDAVGVKTDQTGSGQAYYYKTPCCGAAPLAADFFSVVFPNIGEISRATGLLQIGDDPGQGVGQWPALDGSKFAVNPIDGASIVMSSRRAGRLFLTTGPTLGTGIQWFPIADPTDLDGTYAPAVAFGAPATATSPTSDFIYAGTIGGRIFVTFNAGGGGVGTAWKNISAGLDGSPVRFIATNPTRGTREAYAVTAQGVYWMEDSGVATPTWVNITGNLFAAGLTRTVFNDPTQRINTIDFLSSLQADWRYAIPDNLAAPTGPKHPVLYVGGNGGVYRSLDKGTTWTYFPNQAADGAIQEGGLLPSNEITDLALSVGNINPQDGTPSNQRYGRDMLVATTYGSGVFAIRLNDSVRLANGQPLYAYAKTKIAGPHVVSIAPANTVGALTGITVTFSGPVDPTTFTAADIVSIRDSAGNSIKPLQILAVPRILVDSATGVQYDARDTYTILFAQPATVFGTFTLTMLPNMSDFAGNRLDQNQNSTLPNGANGETPGDIYTGTLTFTINTAPNFNVGPNQVVLEDSGPRTVPNWATGITVGSPADVAAGQTLTFIIDSNSNPSLFAVPPAVSPNGTLTFTPALNANGTATITLYAQDSGGTANGGVDVSAIKTFTITITPVNDRPTFVIGPAQTVLEDAGAQTVNGWATGMSAGPPDEAGQTLTFVVSSITYSSPFFNTNAKFFTTLPTVNPTTGTLTYQLAPNANGTATVFLALTDNGGTANGGQNTSIIQSFTITATPVNDPPSFTVGPNQRTVANSSQSVAAFLKNILDYPAAPPPLAVDEASQSTTFQVTNDNNALFSVQPTIDATGRLVYTTAAGANGVATVTVIAVDNGGTANGGQNTSASQTFTITVKPKGTTTTALTSSANPSVATQLLTFTATVNDITNGGPALTGSVRFTLTGATTGTVTIPVNASGQAVYTSSLFNLGSTTVTAQFLGDANYVASSASLTQVVNKQTSTTTITTTLNGGPAVVGQLVTYRATVTGNGGATPTGNMIFTIDGVALPAVPLVNGVAGTNRAFSTVGNHTITATYVGNATTNGSTTTFNQTVNANPLAIVNVSSTNMFSGTPFSVTVHYRLPNSNAIDTTFNGPVTLALNTSSVAGGTFTTVTVNAVNGVATFTNQVLNKAGTYTLKATTGTLPPAVSPAITATANRLIAGFAYKPVINTAVNLAINAIDATGAVATNYNFPVAARVLSAPAGGSVIGSLTGQITNGVTALTNLRFTKTGLYTLQVYSGNLAFTFTIEVVAQGRVT